MSDYPKHDWTIEEIGLLGTIPDSELAEKIGISASRVSSYRTSKGILGLKYCLGCGCDIIGSSKKRCDPCRDSNIKNKDREQKRKSAKFYERHAELKCHTCNNSLKAQTSKRQFCNSCARKRNTEKIKDYYKENPAKAALKKEKNKLWREEKAKKIVSKKRIAH